MEACGGAHFLCRALREQGHGEAHPGPVREAVCEVELERLPGCPAIAEAVDRQNMRFVPIKTEDQLDLQALHRAQPAAGPTSNSP
jgi:transposase